MKAGDLKPGDLFRDIEMDDSVVMLCIRECDYLQDSVLWDNGDVPFIYISTEDGHGMFEIFNRDRDDEVELINLEDLK